MSVLKKGGQSGPEVELLECQNIEQDIEQELTDLRSNPSSAKFELCGLSQVP